MEVEDLELFRKILTSTQHYCLNIYTVWFNYKHSAFMLFLFSRIYYSLYIFCYILTYVIMLCI